ncbi:divisome protein SepX/GlpR [Streptomyces sp. H27-D2]|uniref:divisome protein SepX/GlpR n=1 Tax=Streptomyces sp. H27-D2 TaxID=3046304 RepID=UPI002DB7D187|nr:hypothetical protein [Streptomyces sp. H27-D2]MEC4015261.1 hypothetical protein [Streptomyces sp. H27-D2]
MSSSGLIYAVIVGAWAAYLVPMWLRRQDELNEARPTERFSTAIRLLSGRAGMERRYAKAMGETPPDGAEASEGSGVSAELERRVSDPDAETDLVDVRGIVAPESADAPGAEARTKQHPQSLQREREHEHERPQQQSHHYPAGSATAAERRGRAKVLARRRRTTTALFLAVTLGAIVAAVGGLALLWAPAVPAALLSAYIIYLRVWERRRFVFTMDQRRAELAAQRLRERRPRPPQAEPAADDATDSSAVTVRTDSTSAVTAAPSTTPHAPRRASGSRALVEETDHAEWVDQQRERERGRTGTEGWEPVPVPLPTYVTAPVAPRATGHVDLNAPDAWSSARSSTAEPVEQPDRAEPEADPAPRPRSGQDRRTRGRGRTPLFDQHADPDRPRAANE